MKAEIRLKESRETYLDPKRGFTGTSLVVQWLRICLPMQGTRVRALVRVDPTCRGACPFTTSAEPVL